MQHLIPFRFQKQWFALEAECVEQILGEQVWMLVPGAPSLFPGVMAWRGRATAILDLSKLVHAAGATTQEPRAADDRPRRTLIAHSVGCTLGIPTDEVREALPREAAQLRPLHVSTMPFCSSEFELLGSIAVVLDLPALIQHTLGAPGVSELR